MQNVSSCKSVIYSAERQKRWCLWWDVSSVPCSTVNKSFFQAAKQISHDFIVCCRKNASHSRETSSPTQTSPLKKENTWQDIAVIEGLCQHNAGTDFIYTFGRYKALSALIRPVSNMSLNISSSSEPVFRGNLAILTFISFQLSYLCNQGSWLQSCKTIWQS